MSSRQYFYRDDKGKLKKFSYCTICGAGPFKESEMNYKFISTQGRSTSCYCLYCMRTLNIEMEDIRDKSEIVEKEKIEVVSFEDKIIDKKKEKNMGIFSKLNNKKDNYPKSPDEKDNDEESKKEQKSPLMQLLEEQIEEEVNKDSSESKDKKDLPEEVIEVNLTPQEFVEDKKESELISEEEIIEVDVNHQGLSEIKEESPEIIEEESPQESIEDTTEEDNFIEAAVEKGKIIEEIPPEESIVAPLEKEEEDEIIVEEQLPEEEEVLTNESPEDKKELIIDVPSEIKVVEQEPKEEPIDENPPENNEEVSEKEPTIVTLEGPAKIEYTYKPFEERLEPQFNYCPFSGLIIDQIKGDLDKFQHEYKKLPGNEELEFYVYIAQDYDGKYIVGISENINVDFISLNKDHETCLPVEIIYYHIETDYYQAYLSKRAIELMNSIQKEKIIEIFTEKFFNRK